CSVTCRPPRPARSRSTRCASGRGPYERRILPAAPRLPANPVRSDAVARRRAPSRERRGRVPRREPDLSRARSAHEPLRARAPGARRREGRSRLRAGAELPGIPHRVLRDRAGGRDRQPDEPVVPRARDRVPAERHRGGGDRRAHESGIARGRGARPIAALETPHRGRPRPVARVSRPELHRVTLFFVVPPVLLMLSNWPELAKYDLSSLRTTMVGAAPVAPELARRFRQLTGVPVLQGYGMTEASPLTHVNPVYDESLNIVDSAGLLAHDT